MIEETGVVVDIRGDWAVVEPSQRTACSSCSVSGGCGTSSLARLFGRRRQQHYAHNPLHAKPGDQVVMGLEEKALLTGSVLMYLVPLIGMILGAILFSEWLGADASSEWAALLGGAGGLIGGLGLAAYVSRRQRNTLYPIIMRILSGSR